MTLQASYDQIPYDSRPIPASHIELLAVEAMLAGLPFAPIERCRVLELGCASGGNLLPMADEFPASQFLGIDLSGQQIAAAQRLADLAALKNVRLIALDLMNLGPDLGQFDYIIAHGLYSWVPPAVQDNVLQIFADHLAPHGVGYISYNAYPGWHHRQIVRDMLLHHTRRGGGGARTPAERVARATGLLQALLATEAGEGNAFGPSIRAEARMQLALGDQFLAHDILEENQNPVDFETFTTRLTAHGLAYLAECRPTPARHRARADVLHHLPELAGDRLALEQYTDFFLAAQFRRSAIVRAASAPPKPADLAQIQRLHARTLLNPAIPATRPDFAAGASATFHMTDGGTLTFTDPLTKAILFTLAQNWPLALSFDELTESISAAHVPAPPADDLARALLDHREAGVLELRFPSERFTNEISPRPAASALIRAMAQQAESLPSRLHVSVGQLTTLDRFLLRQLDGTRDLAALARAVDDAMVAGRLPICGEFNAHQAGILDTVEHSIEASLQKLARHALLIA
jgi:SAM-dependent methyltransferase